MVPLDQLDDFRVASGDPDVRGWEVVGSDGGKIGEVDELLVDTRAMKVRYLDVDLDGTVTRLRTPSLFVCNNRSQLEFLGVDDADAWYNRAVEAAD